MGTCGCLYADSPLSGMLILADIRRAFLVSGKAVRAHMNRLTVRLRCPSTSSLISNDDAFKLGTNPHHHPDAPAAGEFLR